MGFFQAPCVFLGGQYESPKPLVDGNMKENKIEFDEI